MSYNDPCDECGQRPATHGYVCHVCAHSQKQRDLERLLESGYYDEEYDRRKDEGLMEDWGDE